jgi:transcriptional regulator with XRE-family HTH domain
VNDLGVEIGERLREARQNRGLSLRALGEVTGFSASFLSQVELGQASPSLGSLYRIAEALGITVAGLLDRGTGTGAILRKAGRSALRSEWSKATLESLVPASADEKLQAILLRLETAGKTGAMACATGRRLFAYCTSGSVVAVLAEPNEEVVVDGGDSVVLDGPRTVAWENRSASAAEILVVTARIV